METKETQVSKTREKVLNRNRAGNILNKNLGFAAEAVFIIPYNACLLPLFHISFPMMVLGSVNTHDQKDQAFQLSITTSS